MGVWNLSGPRIENLHHGWIDLGLEMQENQGFDYFSFVLFDVAVAKLDVLRSFTVELPADRAFDDIDLSGDKGKELHAVEKDPAQGKR